MLEINKYNKIIAANWKLNGSSAYIDSYFESFNSKEINSDVCGILCPPAIYLQNCHKKLNGIYLGAQDCSNFDSGAYTGDISATMLSDNNCSFCLVGHSERRVVFNQKNKDVKLKAENLIKAGINPIICIGETLDEKKNGITKEVLKRQVLESFPEYSSNKTVIMAYEPVWAIGTGLTPNLEEINETQSFLKNDIKEFKNFKVIYGGSVKAKNASEIMNLKCVDGVLVGGASLDPLEFKNILKA